MLEGIRTDQSVDIFIRHGKSTYSDKFLDLTEEGIAEITESAAKLKEIVLSYPNIRLNTSPAVRALGSLRIFAGAIGIQDIEVTTEQALKPVEIYHFPEFKVALNDPSYKKEYEAYLLKKEFDDPSEARICERRSDIRNRAIDYFIDRMESEDHKEGAEPVCAVHFTHFEIMSALLAALYGDINNFPIDTVEGPKNGEAIAIQKYSPREMTIFARSMSANVMLSELK